MQSPKRGEDQEQLGLPRIRFSVGGAPRIVIRNLKPLVSTAVPSLLVDTPSNDVKNKEDKTKTDDSATDTDDDGHLIQRAMRAKDAMLKRQARLKYQSAKRRRLGPSRVPGVTLKTLLDENLITPGKKMLTLDYLGKTEWADIDPDGKIEWNGMKFVSPSSFSIYVKRRINPSRKADDGWKTVKYNGQYLELYKLQLARRRCPQMKASPSDSPQEEPRTPSRRASPIEGSQSGGSDSMEDTKGASSVFNKQASHLV